jgi:thiaminase/transcriptional activator TenA
MTEPLTPPMAEPPTRPLAEPLSSRLLGLAAEPWERALAMPFVTHVVEDTVPDEVFSRYMWWEGAFVDAAVRVLGAAVLRAPGRAARAGHARTLATLVDDQLAHFDETASAAPGPRSAALAEPLIREVVSDAERFSYAELVVGMLPSELLYAVWCRRAAATPSARPRIAEWVRLHTEPPFTTQVNFLVREVDALDTGEDEVPALAALVARRIELEIDFHAAAYVPG